MSILAMMLLGCDECGTAADCSVRDLCVDGQCQASDGSDLSNTIGSDGGRTNVGGVSDGVGEISGISLVDTAGDGDSGLDSTGDSATDSASLAWRPTPLTAPMEIGLCYVGDISGGVDFALLPPDLRCVDGNVTIAGASYGYTFPNLVMVTGDVYLTRPGALPALVFVGGGLEISGGDNVIFGLSLLETVGGTLTIKDTFVTTLAGFERLRTVAVVDVNSHITIIHNLFLPYCELCRFMARVNLFPPDSRIHFQGNLPDQCALEMSYSYAEMNCSAI